MFIVFKDLFVMTLDHCVHFVKQLFAHVTMQSLKQRHSIGYESSETSPILHRQR